MCVASAVGLQDVQQGSLSITYPLVGWTGWAMRMGYLGCEMGLGFALGVVFHAEA